MDAEDQLYREAFSRNLGLLTEAEQQRLRRACVAIAGMGGVGGNFVTVLARLGIGRLRIADGDTFELANINRQTGATMATIGRRKVEVMAEMAKAINPSCDVRAWNEPITDANCDAFLDGTQLALDGLDFFAMDARVLLFRKAREHGVHAITSAPVGFGATLHLFDPHGMSFERFFDLDSRMTPLETLVSFGVGLTPTLIQRGYFPPSALNLTDGRAPSLACGPVLCSALVGAEAVNLLLGRHPPRPVPWCCHMDPFLRTYRTTYLALGNRHPLQRVKRWWLIRRLAHPEKNR